MSRRKKRRGKNAAPVILEIPAPADALRLPGPDSPQDGEPEDGPRRLPDPPEEYLDAIDFAEELFCQGCSDRAAVLLIGEKFPELTAELVCAYTVQSFRDHAVIDPDAHRGRVYKSAWRTYGRAIRAGELSAEVQALKLLVTLGG